MPSKSKAQHNFMAAVAHNPSFAKKVGVPTSVGKDFNQADKGRKFSKGGDTMASKMNPGFMAMMKKKGTSKMAGGGVAASKMGAVKTAAPSKDGIAEKGKTKGKQIKMAGSGVPGGIGSKVMKKGGMAKC
jgi:hypothetical protein